MGAPEKPDIRELVGMSVNSSSLVNRRGESDLDRLGAMGAAACIVSLGADITGVPIAAAAAEVYRRAADMRDVMLDPGDLDVRDQLAGELAPLLWHIRYGGQHSFIPQAVRLYARWLETRRLFTEYAKLDVDGIPFLERFSMRVLDEWLSERCITCGGGGKQEKSRTGQWLRPRGSMQRNATFRPCTACNGSGRRMASHGERARWVGIDHAKYDAERWDQKFTAGVTWLNQFHAHRMHRPLTAQLERYKKRD